MFLSLKSLFYPILAGLGATSAFLILAWVCERILMKILRNGWRAERKKYKRRLRGNGRSLLGLLLVFVAIAVFFAMCLMGRPLFGLLSLLALPLMTRLLLYLGHSKAREAMDDSALSVFYVLRGLVESGTALPAALFAVSNGTDGAFSLYLRENLNRYSEGASLPEILDRFRRKNELGDAGVYVGILETVYRSGLSVLPLLSEMVPHLEGSIQQRKRIKELRKGVLIQAVVTFLVPWLLLWVLFLFQPEVVRGFLASAIGLAVIGLSILLEALGAWVMWKISEFS